MKVALLPNFDREGTAEIFLKITEILNEQQVEFLLNSDMSDEELYELCDVIITIGGDGTLIKHAKAAAKYGKPCLGVNTGNLGFLANVDKDAVELLKKLKANEYKIEQRMMLEVSAVKNGEVHYNDIALNDAVVSSGSVARIADIGLSIAGDEINYRADGVILSTPTGSTAYSMSAGGPIIDPSVRCLTVTPVCSHSLTARPMILSDNSKIDITILGSSRTNAVLSVDGKQCTEVDTETVVSIKKSELEARFINLTDSTIYKTISKKF